MTGLVDVTAIVTKEDLVGSEVMIEELVATMIETQDLLMKREVMVAGMVVIVIRIGTADGIQGAMEVAEATIHQER